MNHSNRGTSTQKKRHILMLPSWYPTEENPIPGSFFKEQAKCLSADFCFTVLTFNRNHTRFRWCHLWKGFDYGPSFQVIEETDGYIELQVIFTTPTFRHKVDWLLGLFNLHPSRNEEKEYRRFITKTCQELKERLSIEPELVYAMTAQINGDLAMWFSMDLNVPLVLAEHNPFPLPGTLLRPAVREAIEQCDALLAVSHDKIRQILMQNLSCTPMLLGNLVDEEKFTLGVRSGSPTKNLLVVAAYNFYKDFETLFRAIRLLEGITDIEFKLTIVGYSPLKGISDYSYGSSRFKQLLDSYHLKAEINLVPIAKRDKMPEYYAHADAFVMTSIQEGLPVSALEAASCGLPIFSTRCGGVEDFVDDDIGRLVPVRDHEALAACLKDFLEGNIIFDSVQIRTTVLNKYGKEAFRRRFRGIVEPLMEGYSKENKGDVNE